MIKSILYHENNRKHPYIPQEDAYATYRDIYVVADGVTHDKTEDDLYPIPSDSAKVAQIICDELTEYLKDKKPTLESVKEAYLNANHKVQSFNEVRPLYQNRENNGFTIGAATSATIWLDDNKLLYGVIDDCFISIFSDDYVDHPMLKSYVEQSAKFLDSNYNWSNPETRKLWRKEIRNNVYVKDGKEYGYGVIDGRDGFIKYLQLGEVELKPDDLICVYTDGFIKMLQNTDFVKGLREQPFSAETYEYIKSWSEKLDVYKEKTAYFIKH
uniref:PPM-type phosphatase domain-containing protein n=1 Tax=candidate division WWE3 bacterium TaxID=2053526 RepID=A0A7C4Y357_UNCKA